MNYTTIFYLYLNNKVGAEHIIIRFSMKIRYNNYRLFQNLKNDF